MFYLRASTYVLNEDLILSRYKKFLCTYIFPYISKYFQ